MTYSLSNTRGDHLGFVVLSGGPDSGECQVRLMPADSRLVDTQECRVLQSLQTLGEMLWHRDSSEVHVSDADGHVLLVERDGIMKGSGCVFEVAPVE